MSGNYKHATAAAVRRAISAATSAGIQVGSVELLPGSVIRIVATTLVPPTPANEFDRWQAEGRL